MKNGAGTQVNVITKKVRATCMVDNVERMYAYLSQDSVREANAPELDLEARLGRGHPEVEQRLECDGVPLLLCFSDLAHHLHTNVGEFQ